MARRIVAFMDVLGFKALVEKVPHPELVEIYRDLQATTRDQTTRPAFPDDARKYDSDPYYEVHEIVKRRIVNVVLASDSVVIYSDGEGYESISAVATTARALLLSGFRNGIPLRGALTVGELDEVHLDGDAFAEPGLTAHFRGLVGLGLVHAYALEGTCNWSGAILHPDLIAHLDGITLSKHEEGPFSALDALCARRLVLQTRVPVKRRGHLNKSETGWAINWPLLAKAIGLSEGDVAAAFSSFGRSDSSAEVTAKRDETVAFMRRSENDAAITCQVRGLAR